MKVKERDKYREKKKKGERKEEGVCERNGKIVIEKGKKIE